MPNDKSFDIFNASGIKYRVTLDKIVRFNKIYYFFKTISMEKTPMSIYDFQF